MFAYLRPCSGPYIRRREFTSVEAATFSYGGYGAPMPAFVSDYYGARSVGANYHRVFPAWELCRFVVPRYSERHRATVAGNLAAGYPQAYIQIGALSVFERHRRSGPSGGLSTQGKLPPNPTIGSLQSLFGAEEY